MSTPVTTDKWAGNFDCSSCSRKRLMADEFSKKALERYRRNGGPLRCKQCVEAVEQAERAAAAAKRQAQTNSGGADETTTIPQRQCAGGCGKTLPQSAYNKNQYNKGEGVSRCRTCVETAVAQDAAQAKTAQRDKLAAARQAVEDAKKSNHTAAVLRAESVVAALEAEQVTGLKPVRMSYRGRGGRGRAGRSAGRGRR